MESFFCSYAAPMVSWELRTTPYCMHPVFSSSRRPRFPRHRELGALQSITATAAKTLSRLFLFAENAHCRRISRELISWGPHSNLEKEIKIRRRLFASSIERKNRQFHIAVVQWLQRNVQKSAMHVQSWCLLELNLLLQCFVVFVAVAAFVAKAP